MELAAARQELVDQAETIGRLRAEIAVAERRLLELEPGAPRALENPSPLTRPPWWAFWRRWAFPLL